MVQAQSGQMSDEEGDEVRPEQSCLPGPDLLMHEIPDTHSLSLKKTSSAQAAPTNLLAAWLRCIAHRPAHQKPNLAAYNRRLIAAEGKQLMACTCCSAMHILCG